MYCRYGGHLSNNDERTLPRGCTKLHLSPSKMYSDHLHYENMSQTVINSRDQTVAMELSSPYNAMASDANKYYAMEPSSTLSNAMEPSSTHNAMAPSAPILSNAMEPSSNHQIAMAHGAPNYNAMGLGPNNQTAMGLFPNNLSKAITHQALSNAYYYSQPGTMPSCRVGCSFCQDANMQSMCMPDHQVVSVVCVNSKQDAIMQNKASTTVVMPSHSPLPCTGANAIPLPTTKYQNKPIPLPRRSLMNNSNINEKDETTNTVPSCSCPGLLSSSNLSKPQIDSTLIQNTMTLPQHHYTFPHYGQHISTTHVSANQSSAQRSWGSETTFHDHQSVRNLKEVQGASCQTRYPESHTEIVDDRVFIVPPCNVSSNVCTYKGGNNKRLTLTHKEPPNLIVP